MANSPQKQLISISMNKEIYDRLTNFCETLGQSKTVIIERAVAEYISNDSSHRNEQSKIGENDHSIEELLIPMKEAFPEFLGSYCTVNGAIMKLEEIQKMGFHEFALRSKINMPLKLYKYYPNILKEDDDGIKRNHSMEALKNNTVYLQSPSEFDDAFDSDIVIDNVEYEKLRLKEYCQRCSIHVDKNASIQEISNALLQKLYDVFLSTNDFIGAFIEDNDSEIKSLSNKTFCMELKNQMLKGIEFGQALRNVITNDYINYCKYIKETFRISCFATTPLSQLMWATYADCHRGFCLEYTIIPGEAQYENEYLNLFPMIYCKTRPNITERLVKYQNEKPTQEQLWDIFFHGVLRKSFDWAYQNEWRLLLPFSPIKKEDYNIKFFPITKVYLGNKMTAEKRKEIINVCHEKSIPYIGVIRNPDLYEMEGCKTLCEDCNRMGT